jgi:hypothetical protein
MLYLSIIKKLIKVMFEEKLVKQVKGGLMGIKLGTKSPKEVFDRLSLLKKYNQYMFEELFQEYTRIVDLSK